MDHQHPRTPPWWLNAHPVIVAMLLLFGTIVPFRVWPQSPSGLSVSHVLVLRVREIAILDISDAPPLEVIVAQGASARLSRMSDTGTALLCYTLTNLIGQTRSIMVQWLSSDATPAGTSLYVEAVSVPAGCGVASGKITVSSLPQALIRIIPSCATGAGAEIRYRFVVDNPSVGATAAHTAVTICFTFCDDS